jgi:hypothetical protein
MSQHRASPLLRKTYGDFLSGRAPVPKVRELLSFKGVTRSQKGILVNTRLTSSSTFALFSIISAFYKSDQEIATEFKERTALVNQLRSLGFKVVVPYYDEVTSRNDILPHMAGKVRTFKARLPVRPEVIGKTREVHPNAFWARDLWVKVGGRRKKFFSKFEDVDFAEGGRWVSINERSHLVSVSLKDDPHCKDLVSSGHKLYFLNDGYRYEPRVSRLVGSKVYLSVDHPDLFVGVIGKVMVVDYDYFRQNRDTLRQAARDNGLEIVYIPPKEADIHPANFLPLGENRILIDKSAVETSALLRARGIEVVPTTEPMEMNRSAGGGVRCIVNEL